MSSKLQILILIISVACVMSTDFNSDSYIKQTASSKMSLLWSQISQDQTSFDFFSPLKMPGIFIESMKPTFDNAGDEMPNGRNKYIHTVGNTAQVEYIAEPNQPFTGMFKGAKSALIRLSVAKKADFTKTSAIEALDNFTPGFGLKLLRDNLPSANVVSMFGVNGIPSWNFFAKDFFNHIPAAGGVALTLVAQKFSSATNHVQTVGLKDMAEFDQNGKKETNIKFPWKLIFRAPAAIKSLFPDNFVISYLEQLKTIPPGQVLYEVYAIEEPSAGKKNCETLIGTLKLKSQLITSMWGDKNLFFRHGKMEEDLKIRPEWTEYTPMWHFMNIDKTKETPEGGCPFKRLWA